MRGGRRKSIEVRCNMHESGAKEAYRRRPRRGWNIHADILTLGSRNSRLSGKQRAAFRRRGGISRRCSQRCTFLKKISLPRARIRFASCAQRATRRQHSTGLFVLRRLILGREQSEKGDPRKDGEISPRWNFDCPRLSKLLCGTLLSKWTDHFFLVNFKRYTRKSNIIPIIRTKDWKLERFLKTEGKS